MNNRTKQQFKNAIKEWKPVFGREMGDLNEIYRGDREDLQCVLNLMLAEQWDQAYTIASRLDTAVREVIPHDAWVTLQLATGVRL